MTSACALLTGDQDLNVDDTIAALTLMKEGTRRLPWTDAERILNGLRQDA